MFDRHLKVWPTGLPQHLELPETSLYANLQASATAHPDKPATIYYGSALSYAELKRQVDALAGYLQDQGVRKGDRVLLYMQNSPQFIIGYYAILRADAVVVPVNPMNKTAELEYLVQDTGANVALCGQEVYPALAPLLHKTNLARVVVAAYADYVTEPTDLTLPAEVSQPRQAIEHPKVTLWSEALAAGKVPGAHTAGPSDLAVIPYSSGTTGNPKGCVHTHRSVMATTIAGGLWLGSQADTVQLVTVPMFHVTGMQVCMNAGIQQGHTLVLMTRWDRNVAAALIQRYRVSCWIAISTMVVDTLANPDIGKYDLSNLKMIMGGGAAMPAAVAEKLFEMTGLRYIEGYGLTETMAPTHINPPQAPKAQCLGIPIFDVDARVIDLDTLEELGPGETGEIVVNGPQVFQGYWNRPEETAKAFIELDGKRFFRTGDLGHYDEEGYFFIVDRVKRMINASGFKVWPTEVESLMYAHPKIQEVCVISAPHPRRGETVKAVVVPRTGVQVTEAEIIAWCKENMAAYKVPEIVEFVQELPKSPTGKLMWRALQEQEWAKARSA